MLPSARFLSHGRPEAFPHRTLRKAAHPPATPLRGPETLAAGRPGTSSEGWIYLHFEGNVPHDSHVARFNLSWLLKGKKTGDGELPAWIAAERR